MGIGENEPASAGSARTAGAAEDGGRLAHGMRAARFPLPFAAAPYTRVLFDDEWVFVSGTLGMDYDRQRLASGASAQTRQMMANIARYLEVGGSGLDQIVNYTLIITAQEHLQPVVDALLEALPDKPTGTAMIAGIVVPDAVVEMQVIARKRPAPQP